MTSVPKVIDVEVALQEKIPDIYQAFVKRYITPYQRYLAETKE